MKKLKISQLAPGFRYLQTLALKCRENGLEYSMIYRETSRVVYIMLNVSQYYANFLCSTNVTIMLK